MQKVTRLSTFYYRILGLLPLHKSLLKNKLSVPASTTTMANQSQSPLPPLATAAAGVRLWDRDWAAPGSVDIGLEEGLGLEQGKKKRMKCYHSLDK